MISTTPPRHVMSVAARIPSIDRSGWLLGAVAITVALSAIFWLFPALDVAAAAALYAPPRGFIGEQSPALVVLLRLGRAIGWAVGALIIGVVVLRVVKPEWVSLSLRRRWWVTVLAVLLGPGLLVNGILKAYMGRPRPIQTTLFGGKVDFVPVWTYSKGCATNCSFVSGEASFGLFLIIFAFWLSGTARWAAFGVIGLFGVAMSVNRMAFGAHFLSDVLLAWSLTALVILLIDRYLPERLVAL
jgi:lipid A 4'-phosphatase